MLRAFFNAKTFNENIDSWQTTAVTTMESMFNGASAFNQHLGSWQTTAVTRVNNMFSAAIAFNQGLGSWQMAAVKDMRNMFLYTALSACNKAAIATAWKAQGVVASGMKNYDGTEDWSTLQTCGTCAHP